uniref:Uncharacterized protein n=2 Tax=Micrurus lemniscatus lemniscatus TaxID=129467 RepID=A0A2D4IU41_MICLE
MSTKQYFHPQIRAVPPILEPIQAGFPPPPTEDLERPSPNFPRSTREAPSTPTSLSISPPQPPRGTKLKQTRINQVTFRSTQLGASLCMCVCVGGRGSPEVQPQPCATASLCFSPKTQQKKYTSQTWLAGGPFWGASHPFFSRKLTSLSIEADPTSNMLAGGPFFGGGHTFFSR